MEIVKLAALRTSENHPDRMLYLKDGRGDDRSVKIESLETAKIIEIKWLVLGCIEANFFYKILVRKLLTRSIRFAFLCTSPTSKFQQIFVTNFGDVSQIFK